MSDESQRQRQREYFGPITAVCLTLEGSALWATGPVLRCGDSPPPSELWLDELRDVIHGIRPRFDDPTRCLAFGGLRLHSVRHSDTAALESEWTLTSEDWILDVLEISPALLVIGHRKNSLTVLTPHDRSSRRRLQISPYDNSVSALSLARISGEISVGVATGDLQGFVEISGVEIGVSRVAVSWRSRCSAAARHGGPVNCVSFLTTGSETVRVATGSDDRTVRIWGVVRGGELVQLRVMTGHEGRVWQCVGTPEEEVVSCGEDGTVRFWRDGVQRRAVRQARGPENNLWALTAGPGRVVSGGDDGFLRRIFDAGPGASEAQTVHCSGPVQLVAFKPRLNAVVYALESGAVMFQELGAEPSLVTTVDEGPCSSLSFRTDPKSGATLVGLGTARGSTMLCERQPGSTAWTAVFPLLLAAPKPKKVLEVKADSRLLVYLQSDSCHLRSQGTGEDVSASLAQRFDRRDCSLSCFCVLAQANIIVLGDTAGCLYALDRTSLAVVQVLRRCHGNSRVVAVKPVGPSPSSLLASAGNDGSVVVWQGSHDRDRSPLLQESRVPIPISHVIDVKRLAPQHGVAFVVTGRGESSDIICVVCNRSADGTVLSAVFRSSSIGVARCQSKDVSLTVSPQGDSLFCAQIAGEGRLDIAMQKAQLGKDTEELCRGLTSAPLKSLAVVDSSFVLAGTEAGQLLLFEVTDGGRVLHRDERSLHTSTICCILVSETPGGRRLVVTAGGKLELCLWEVEHRGLVSLTHKPESFVPCLKRFLKVARSALTDVVSECQITSLCLLSQFGLSCPARVLCCLSDGHLCVLSVIFEGEAPALAVESYVGAPWPNSFPRSCCRSSQGAVVVGYSSGHVSFFPLDPSDSSASPRVHQAAVMGLSFSQDGSWVVSCGDDQSVCATELSVAPTSISFLRIVRLDSCDWASLSSLTSIPATPLFVTASPSQRLRTWELRTCDSASLLSRGEFPTCVSDASSLCACVLPFGRILMVVAGQGFATLVHTDVDLPPAHHQHRTS